MWKVNNEFENDIMNVRLIEWLLQWIDKFAASFMIVKNLQLSISFAFLLYLSESYDVPHPLALFLELNYCRMEVLAIEGNHN